MQHHGGHETSTNFRRMNKHTTLDHRFAILGVWHLVLSVECEKEAESSRGGMGWGALMIFTTFEFFSRKSLDCLQLAKSKYA